MLGWNPERNILSFFFRHRDLALLCKVSFQRMELAWDWLELRSSGGRRYCKRGFLSELQVQLCLKEKT